jgi:hypothetical protein
MNCRATKQHQQPQTTKLTDLSHQTLQSKRSKNTNTNNNTMNIKKSFNGKLNRSNEGNELLDNIIFKSSSKDDIDENELKNNKKAKICTNCNCESNNKIESTPSQLITPMKPEDFNKKFSSNLTKTTIPTTPLTTTKWTCSTCLVQNDDSKTSCAGCSSLRQSSLTETTKKIDEIKSSSKWTCTTCLVQNDELITSCACCSTSKPNTIINNSNNAKWTCSECLVKNDYVNPMLSSTVLINP